MNPALSIPVNSTTNQTEKADESQNLATYLATLSPEAISDIRAGRWDEVMTDGLYAAVGAATTEEMRDARESAEKILADAGQNNTLDYAASVRHAIKRSISHNEIVRTAVPASDYAAMMDYLADQEDIEEIDSGMENDGTLDVWGKFKGDDFRIRFTKEARK